MKLRTRMTLLLILPVVMGLALMGSVIGIFVARSNQANFLGMAELTAKARAAEVERWIQGRLLEIERTVSDPAVRSGDIDLMGEYLLQRHDNLPSDVAFEFCADLNGDYITSAGGSGNISARSYFQEILAGADVAVSEGLVSKSTGLNMTYIAVPIKDDKGELIGVGASAVSLETLSEIVSISISETAMVLLWIAI